MNHITKFVHVIHEEWAVYRIEVRMIFVTVLEMQKSHLDEELPRK